MTKANRFTNEMRAIDKALAEDPETKDRYARATVRGKKWLCFSAWLAKDRERWQDLEAAEYRDSLASWLGSIDIAYVLQFEKDTRVAEYLRGRLAAAVERENTDERLCRKESILTMGLYKGTIYNGKTTAQLANCQGVGMICRLYSAMKGYAAYLRGVSPGASFWVHPDCRLYLGWYNKYYAPTSGLVRVQ